MNKYYKWLALPAAPVVYHKSRDDWLSLNLALIPRGLDLRDTPPRLDLFISTVKVDIICGIIPLIFHENQQVGGEIYLVNQPLRSNLIIFHAVYRSIR